MKRVFIAKVHRTVNGYKNTLYTDCSTSSVLTTIDGSTRTYSTSYAY